MIRATITVPVASSRLMVAPWSTDIGIWSLTEKSKRSLSMFSCGLLRSLLRSHASQLTRGSLFFTSLTIFTDSSSSSSSKSSGSGGSTGSKFFWATVSCTERTAWRDRKPMCWDYNADVELHREQMSTRIYKKLQRWMSGQITCLTGKNGTMNVH